MTQQEDRDRRIEKRKAARRKSIGNFFGMLLVLALLFGLVFLAVQNIGPVMP